MESYDSMHGIVWNHTDHMLPCMELHESLMNLDPGSDEEIMPENRDKVETRIRDTLTWTRTIDLWGDKRVHWGLYLVTNRLIQ